MAKQIFNIKILIRILLVFFILSGFFIRLNNFARQKMKTVDCVVYIQLASQMNSYWPEYNSIAMAKVLQMKGKTLFPYLWEPLYKYPPLFTMLNVLSLRLFGDIILSLGILPALAGVLLIPLSFWLGKLLFDEKIGLVSAFLVYLDPILTISSQKVWPDTTLALFMFLGVCLFCCGLKYKKNWCFILMGISCGLAVWVKYPGLLSIIFISLFAVLLKPDLFKKKSFQFGCVFPFISLLPWAYWNYRVYGIKMIEKFFMNEPGVRSVNVLLFDAILVFLFVAGFSLYKMKNYSAYPLRLLSDDGIRKKWLLSAKLFLCLVFVWLLRDSLFFGLSPKHFPYTNWSNRDFHRQMAWGGYFAILLRYSFIYAFAFLALPFKQEEDNREEVLFLKIYAILGLAFFMFWGNYQSRYILPLVPVLIVLGVSAWFKLLRMAGKVRLDVICFLVQLGLRGILIVIIAKTYNIDRVISFLNNMCYF